MVTPPRPPLVHLTCTPEPHRWYEDLLPELPWLIARRWLEVRVLLEQLLNHAMATVLKLVTVPEEEEEEEGGFAGQAEGGVYKEVSIHTHVYVCMHACVHTVWSVCVTCQVGDTE